ncbi:MAG: FAD:protein FMN transferase [Halieaceae bacterium]|nr:FAD:protein FMN transferase [Halieaceae bacterium]
MPLYDHSFRAMGGPCRLRLECDHDGLARRAIAAAEAEVRRLEAKYSRYLPESLTSRINRAAGAEPVSIDEETAGLLGFADTLWQQSEGLFDLTAGVLRRAWDFSSGKLPAQAAIDPDRVKTPLQSLRFRSGRLGALCGRFRQFSVKLRGLPHLTSLEFMWPGEPLSAPRGAQKLDGGHLCPHRRHQR